MEEQEGAGETWDNADGPASFQKLVIGFEIRGEFKNSDRPAPGASGPRVGSNQLVWRSKFNGRNRLVACRLYALTEPAAPRSLAS